VAQGDPQQARTGAAAGALTRVDAGEGQLVLERDDTEAIEQAMGQARQQIEDGLETLQDKIQKRTDVTAWVRDHPLEAVGIAFGLGFLLGARPYL
jgi:ElaB/YqjD/DUF883 family membrane-anchored ribosome-binding protein